MSKFEDAEDAILEAAAAVASEAMNLDISAGQPGADALKTRAEALDIVALAVSRLKHGPQGGEMDYRYTANVDKRTPAGFTPP